MNKILNLNRYGYRDRKEVRQKHRTAIAIIKTQAGWSVILPKEVAFEGLRLVVGAEWLSSNGVMRRVIAFTSTGLPVTESADGVVSKWEERLFDEIFHKLVRI